MFLTTIHPLYFLLIKVSFLTYLVMLTTDKTLLTFLAITDISVSCLQSKSKLKQDSWFYSHPGHCSLGGFSKWPCLASPLCICLIFPLNNHIPLSFTGITLKKADRWGKDMASLWGNFNIYPQLHWLELPCHCQVEVFSISSLKVWGDAR